MFWLCKYPALSSNSCPLLILASISEPAFNNYYSGGDFPPSTFINWNFFVRKNCLFSSFTHIVKHLFQHGFIDIHLMGNNPPLLLFILLLKLLQLGPFCSSFRLVPALCNMPLSGWVSHLETWFKLLKIKPALWKDYTAKLYSDKTTHLFPPQTLKQTDWEPAVTSKAAVNWTFQFSITHCLLTHECEGRWESKQRGLLGLKWVCLLS